MLMWVRIQKSYNLGAPRESLSSSYYLLFNLEDLLGFRNFLRLVNCSHFEPYKSFGAPPQMEHFSLDKFVTQ